MSTRPPKASVLVVDDDAVLRSLMTGILRNGDYSVVGECSSAAALPKLLVETRPKVVLLDINLPDANGLELLVKIKAMKPPPAVVMVSGEATLDRVKEAMGKGAAGFVVKPFNAAKLLAALDLAVKG